CGFPMTIGGTNSWVFLPSVLWKGSPWALVSGSRFSDSITPGNGCILTVRGISSHCHFVYLKKHGERKVFNSHWESVAHRNEGSAYIHDDFYSANNPVVENNFVHDSSFGRFPGWK